MLFNSATFLLFLPLVLVVYHACPRRAKGIVLLVSSYVFYGAWDARFLALLIGSTLVDFLCARAIPGASRGGRRALLLTSVVVNLGALGFFKYFGFFVDSLSALLHVVGLSALDSVTLRVILPMGISFYTFQTMAYTIDVYRGNQEPCESWIDYAVFVAYFPQLVAGPIERASRLIPQIEARRPPSLQMVRDGLTLMLIGFFKKVVVGDALISPYVDRAFSDPAGQEAPFLFLGALLFSIQLYVDFSGYSDIARGASRLLGIELMSNFTQPLLAVDITEFWRRWHISLSSWLRDYLYVTLGGNRTGVARTYRNLMLTMLLGGLWHGASWNFVIWGGLHGLYLAVHRAFTGRGGRRPPDRSISDRGLLRSAAGVLITNLLVAGTLIFFRASDFETALDYWAGLAGIGTGSGTVLLALCALGLHFAIVLVLDLPARLAGRDEVTEALPAWARVVAYTALILCIWIAWPSDYSPFIYFQF